MFHAAQDCMHIDSIPDPIDLQPLAASIRRSSNFRFAWQFYSVFTDALDSLGTVTTILDAIIAQPELHSFLTKTLDDIYPRQFRIEPLHKHASITPDGSFFLDTVARASLDRLGAYSRDLSPTTAQEREPIHKLFSQKGRYSAFTVVPGNKSVCDICRQHNSHVFSNWFYDVAWDYTFLVSWPNSALFWMGCLTDTD